MEFLARATPSNKNQDPNPTSMGTAQNTTSTPSQTHNQLPSGAVAISPVFTGAAQESYVRDAPKTAPEDIQTRFTEDDAADNEVFGYMPQAQASPGAEGRWEGRHGELGQMDAEWMLSLCEGDGFNLQMLNEMMRFEPSLGA